MTNNEKAADAKRYSEIINAYYTPKVSRKLKLTKKLKSQDHFSFHQNSYLNNESCNDKT